MIADITELDLPDARGAADNESSAALCLLAVADYFGIEPHDGGAFERLCRDASTPEDVLAAAQDLGLSAALHPLTPDLLAAKLTAGMPILVNVGADYGVLMGLSVAGLLVFDPQSGTEIVPVEDLLPTTGIVVDLPGVQRHTDEFTRPLHPHEALAHHYSAVWNRLHDQGEQVPHWELNGAHENLAGTDWHVDLGHDGVWRPLHHEDMQRIYLWPVVEKDYAGLVEKGRRRKVDPQQGLFGQWVNANEQPARKTPQSSAAFEGLHPRQPRGEEGGRGGRFSRRGQIGDARQPSLFDPPRTETPEESGAALPVEQLPEHKPAMGGVTIAGQLPSGDFERLHPRAPKGEGGGRFVAKPHAEVVAEEHAVVQDAAKQAGEPEHPQAAEQVRETRERAVVEERERAAKEPVKKQPERMSYDQTVAHNLNQMGSSPEEWSAVPVTGTTEVDTGGGKMRAMPNFKFPEGYKDAPSIFQGMDDCCQLCGHDIKNYYWIQNDEKKWLMGVGSECVGRFGEGESGEKLAKKDIATANRDFVQQMEDTARQLYAKYSYEADEIHLGRRTGRRIRKWALHEPGAQDAKRIHDAITAALGHVTAKRGGWNPDIGKHDPEMPVYSDRQLANWAKKNGEKARALLEESDVHLHPQEAAEAAERKEEAETQASAAPDKTPDIADKTPDIQGTTPDTNGHEWRDGERASS